MELRFLVFFREPHFAAAEKLVEADKGRSMAKYSQAILQ